VFNVNGLQCETAHVLELLDAMTLNGWHALYAGGTAVDDAGDDTGDIGTYHGKLCPGAPRLDLSGPPCLTHFVCNFFPL